MLTSNLCIEKKSFHKKKNNPINNKYQQATYHNHKSNFRINVILSNLRSRTTRVLTNLWSLPVRNVLRVITHFYRSDFINHDRIYLVLDGFIELLPGPFPVQVFLEVHIP